MYSYIYTFIYLFIYNNKYLSQRKSIYLLEQHTKKRIQYIKARHFINYLYYKKIFKNANDALKCFFFPGPTCNWRSSPERTSMAETNELSTENGLVFYRPMHDG